MGNTAIVKVAEKQLGNHGGRKFWSWYGFTSRMDWCAIFVSWCADQCGYIESGTIPKVSVVSTGANWFKTRHQWQGRSYVEEALRIARAAHEGQYEQGRQALYRTPNARCR